MKIVILFIEAIAHMALAGGAIKTLNDFKSKQGSQTYITFIELFAHLIFVLCTISFILCGFLFLRL